MLVVCKTGAGKVIRTSDIHAYLQRNGIFTSKRTIGRWCLADSAAGPV